MPGRMAHHELGFGALGQTLTLRHDSIHPRKLHAGVVMAIREAVRGPGLTIGLENIMGSDPGSRLSQGGSRDERL